MTNKNVKRFGFTGACCDC